MGIGLDVGTYNIVYCAKKQGEPVLKREINAFLEMPVDNRAVFNMMQTNGVHLIERKDLGIAYALGEAAVDFAYTFNAPLKRPMKDGCLNPKERNGLHILATIIHGMLGEVADGETLYYSVPSNAVNDETDAEYHSKVIEKILLDFEDANGHHVKPFPINEALALIYSELQDKQNTGIGVSCGAGMINLCFAIYGNPIFSFAVVNSGDWIDKQAARATGESIAFINKEKQNIDFTRPSESLVEQAIRTEYEIMINKTVADIKKGLEATESKARVPGGTIDIVVAGGTASPPGFEKLFEDAVNKHNLPIKIGKIIKPAKPLYSVARGCLIAAEASEMG